MIADPLQTEEGGVALSSIAAAAGPWDELLNREFAAAGSRDPATRLMIVDLLTYLPGDILTKVDRMSMAVSLEARVPLLDHKLVEFVMSLPASLKLRGGGGKWLLRQALQDVVPGFVFSKPKQGFGVPLRDWFNGPLAYRIDGLSSSGSVLHEFVESTAIAAVTAEHRRGRRDHSPLLWKLVVLKLWLEDLARSASPRHVRAPVHVTAP
jgi:asparagine synthase (glutamine-hydrolysing)